MELQRNNSLKLRNVFLLSLKFPTLWPRLGHELAIDFPKVGLRKHILSCTDTQRLYFTLSFNYRKHYEQTRAREKRGLPHPTQITPFPVLCTPSAILNLCFSCYFLLLQSDGTELFHFVHGCVSWADYLKNMAADGTWADHVILHAAANCFKTSIHVISSLSDRHDVTISPEGAVDCSGRLVLGHIFEHHYVSLRPKPGKAALTLQT